MTNDRIMEIARQFEAYRDNKVPTVRGDDLVLFARQVIDEAIAGHDTGVYPLTDEQKDCLIDRGIEKCADGSAQFLHVIEAVERYYGIRQ